MRDCTQLRNDACSIFHSGVAGADPEIAIASAVEVKEGKLMIQNEVYDKALMISLQ